MKENKGGVFVPKLQEMMTEKNKKLPPLISGGWVGGQGGGGADSNTGASWVARATTRGVGGLLLRGTCLGSRLYLPPCLLRCQG